MRRLTGIAGLGVIAGLMALLMAAAVGCDDPSPGTATEPSVPPAMSTYTPTPTDPPTPRPTRMATPTLTNTPVLPTATPGPANRRETPLEVSGPELSDLVSGNSAFAFDLYQTLRDDEGNLFYSPYSISVALAMTYAGARGETERQIADTLRFLLPQDNLHRSLNALDLEIASRGEGAEEKDGEGFRLNVVNAVWGQDGYPFLPDFLDVLATNYGAGVRSVDFIEAPEEARVKINDWVAEQTEDRIKDLIPEDVIDDMTRLVLTNAIYFNAAWLHRFTKSSTAPGTFRLLDGRSIEAPMMRRKASFGYAKGDGYQAVELPYNGNELSMVILLPDAGQFTRFEDSLDAGLVLQLFDDLTHKTIILTMPKFQFESDFSLKDILISMGMPHAFDECRADFSGMNGYSCLENSSSITTTVQGGTCGEARRAARRLAWECLARSLHSCVSSSHRSSSAGPNRSRGSISRTTR